MILVSTKYLLIQYRSMFQFRNMLFELNHTKVEKIIWSNPLPYNLLKYIRIHEPYHMTHIRIRRKSNEAISLIILMSNSHRAYVSLRQSRGKNTCLGGWVIQPTLFHYPPSQMIRAHLILIFNSTNLPWTPLYLDDHLYYRLVGNASNQDDLQIL